MHKRTSNVGLRSIFLQARHFIRNFRVASAAVVTVFCLASLALPTQWLQAADSLKATKAASGEAGGRVPLAETLGVHFIPGSSSTLLIERDGKTYLVDIAGQSVHVKDSPSPPALDTQANLQSAHPSPQDIPPGVNIFAEKCASCHGASGKGGGAEKTPDLTRPTVQAALSDSLAIKIIRDGKKGTTMPAWRGKLTEAEINAVASFVKSLGQGKAPEHGGPPTGSGEMAKVYEPADDYLFSMPTGRRLDRHGFYFNFTHRFGYTPAFSGTGSGDTLFGLDDFSISSFGLRYGVTDKFSVSAYRSPSIIGRPIELMAAYNLWDEHDGEPLNVAVRASVDGQGNFSKNFTTNLEMILSRSVTRHAQLYFAPTLSLQNRELIQKPGSLASSPPNLPGINSFSLGIGGAVDIRPTVALVAEVFPTLVNGPELGIHRPAFAFGIQKRVLHHAFTLGFSTGPGTVVSQRAGTRATFLGEPSADTPGGLFIGFDLMRQIR